MGLNQTFGLQQVSDVGASTTNALAILSDSNGFSFGASSQGNIKYNGTNFLITASSGYVSTSTTALYANNIALGASVPLSTTVLTMDQSSSTITGGLTSTFEYSGSGATARAMVFEGIYSGSNAAPALTGGSFTATLGSDNSGTAAVFGTKAVAQLESGLAVTQGTKVLKNEFDIGGDAAGHTGGTIRATSGLFRNPPNFTGGVTLLRWGINCLGDFQVSTGRQIILEGSETAKGDSYLVFETTTANKIQVFVDGTNMVDFRAATINLVDAINIVAGSSTGNKIGTAITQKLGFYGVTPIAQRAGAAQAAVATTAATNVAPYGYTTAAQADAIVTLVNELRAWAVAQGMIKGAA
jgi:hypothetical protein